MPENNFNIKGLSDEQVILAREKFGQNKLSYKKENGIVETFKKSAKEPMILLLLVASYLFCKWKNWRWNFSFPP
nr:cation-transporting P-type ATPase [Candidatus Brachybacter algidus]